jgi:hypothetical protein
VTAEGYEVCVAGADDLFGGVWFEAAGGDDLVVEDLSQLHGCDWLLAFFEDDVAFDAGFGDVEVGEVEAVELIDEVAVERFGVAVVHAVPGAAGSDACGGAVASPDGGDGFDGCRKKRERFSMEPP